MTSLADIYAWSGTTRSIAVCHICAAAVTVGVDAHDAGISADGVELFACGRCCGVAWIARRIAAVIAEHRRPRHPLAPPRPLLILLRDAVPHAVPHSPQGVTNGTEEADRG